jgi:hypothetical protein
VGGRGRSWNRGVQLAVRPTTQCAWWVKRAANSTAQEVKRRAVGSHLRVRIITQPTEVTIDGLRVADFKPGHVYALPVELATLMIVEGWAEPIMNDEAPDLPPFRFAIIPFVPRRTRPRRFTSPLHAPRAGLAAERKKGKPPRRK